MLQLKNISKQYKTGTLVQMALNDVSLNLRDNEFISILGASGSGKTTLLNIIGGLDRYDNGNMIIDGISTQKYNNRAWDAYRNHTIGFIFQSYNLIPHQTVLSNVEIALTIGGVKKGERRKRAEDALKEVGLEEHMHKKPNQLSGGQMQRVAIARAIINDPKIILADEPTGALDTETGIQVMEILKKIAKKRLVVMVTHNPELAQQYSTRIVKLRDGKIVDDTDPYVVEETSENEVDDKKKLKNITTGKSKMSFATSLLLSFNNLRTKKGRTILTAFAGSIGIIGIALITALSTGANEYVEKMQRDTMISYPITIEAVSYDYNYESYDLLSAFSNSYSFDDKVDKSDDGKIKVGNDLYYNGDGSLDDYEPKMVKNNLGAFKKYIEDPANKFNEYLGTGSINLMYDTYFSSYINNNGEYTTIDNYCYFDDDKKLVVSLSGYSYDLCEIPKGADNSILSQKVTDNYEVIYGSWPQNDDECVLVADNSGYIDTILLYKLGYITQQEAETLWAGENEKEVEKISQKLTNKKICGKEIYIVPQSLKYKKNAKGFFETIDESKQNELKKTVEESKIKIKISGIVRGTNYNAKGLEDNCIAYTYKISNKIIDATTESAVIKAQLADKETDVTTGYKFNETDETKLAEKAKKDMSNLYFVEKSQAYTTYINKNTNAYDYVKLSNNFDEWLKTASNKEITDVYKKLNIQIPYEEKLKEIGFVSYDQPNRIVIYPSTFEGKQNIQKLIEEYNENAEEKNKIKYDDYIQDITSGITNMIDNVSYLLIAFVAISLVVSCIMIGIITHISVLERTKEIGILRALGASRANISQVFNAETFIIGLLSGTMGVGIAALLTFPINSIVTNLTEQGVNFHASVPIAAAVMLIAISILITVIGGLIPAKKASYKDPVIALRTE